jgi:queuine tRNA-ribosyltransferase
MMNTFHLMQHPGSSTIRALGGLHEMAGWRGPIILDSGGFQAYSLIRQNPKYGSLSSRGLAFRPDGAARSFHLTPEKAIQLQLSYGSDVVTCLDDCTHAEAPLAVQEESVQRTIDWARRCRQEFRRRLDERGTPQARQPLLFAVIQGGSSRELRRRCAEALLELGFDGFGYGGWPLDGKGNLLLETLAYTRELVPPEFPLHALGVGNPGSVVACAGAGYDLFDSAMPTRDARHGRLYVFASGDAALEGKWFSYLYPTDSKHIKTGGPISPFCDCPCCARYSLGYLHHLFKIGDSLFARLATMHNLRFMTQLMERLRQQPDGFGDSDGRSE